MVISYEDYKGNKLIVLKRNEQDEFPFKFDKNKARLIMENLEAIKEFAEDITPVKEN
jgi:hypothetical protein